MWHGDTGDASTRRASPISRRLQLCESISRYIEAVNSDFWPEDAGRRVFAGLAVVHTQGGAASTRLGPCAVSNGNGSASDFMLKRGYNSLESDTALVACTGVRRAGQIES